MKKYRKQYLTGIFYILIANILFSISPYILKHTINSIEKGISTRVLIGYAGLIVGVAVLHLIFRFLMRYTMIGASRKIEYEFRNDFFSHLLKLPLSFYQKYKTGDLMARATNDLNAVRDVLGPGIMHSVSNLMLLFFIVGFMLHSSVKLTLFAIVPLPLITILSKIFMKHIFTIFKKSQEQYSEITARAQENISGVRVVKAYVQEEREISEFQKLNHHYLQLNLKLTRIRSILFAGITFLMGVGLVIVILGGGSLVVNKHLKIGDFIAFTLWLNMLAWPLISFGWILNLLQQGAASMNRIVEILDTVPDIQDDVQFSNQDNDEIFGEIEFRNVSFSYQNSHLNVLENINLKIPQGKTLGIIGPTGSGKTTLVNLIPRLFDIDQGQLLIDGKEIKNIPLKNLRKNIGYVPQESFLFSDTIYENIKYGVEAVEHSEIEESATLSTIKFDLESFPDKYETLLGERGITLSGGQKQRTALSRALIRKPGILILDDAFASVDSNTENDILNHFKLKNTNQTTIIITHRISTIQNADLIIVLNNGKILEQGDHRSLLKLNGFYANLYNKQLIEEDLNKM